MKLRITAFLLCLVLILTMLPPSVSAEQTLTITKQPKNTYAYEGQTAKTTVTAQGDDLSYQWYVKNPGDADFKKSTVQKMSYSFTMKASSSGRLVYCVITDGQGNSVTSDTVSLKIPTTLKILKQPNSCFGKIGETVVTSVNAQGDELRYQWYLKNANQNKFYKSSITDSRYSVTMSKKIVGRQIYCVITDRLGNRMVTDTVTLNLPASIMLIQQPTDTYTFMGDKITTSVVAEGEDLTYQWYVRNAGKSKFSKSSITSATYTATMTEKSAGRQIYCVITAKDGSTLQTRTVTLHRTGLFLEDYFKIKSNGGTKNLANYLVFETANQLTWSSSDKTIAKVDGTGTVTGLKNGTVTITVTEKDTGNSVKCTVKVCDLKQVALTFDDGPSTYTMELLDFLRENDVPVTFFVVGDRISSYPNTLQQAVKDGHEMGYHSYAHKTQTGLSDSQIISDFEKSNDLLRKLTGAEFTLWRTPGGNYNQRVLDCIDLPHIMWSVDTRDWDHRNSYKVYTSVKGAKDGSIVLMHDLYSTTVDGAIRAIEEMLEEDYEFLTVTELLSRNGSTPKPNTSYSKG